MKDKIQKKQEKVYKVFTPIYRMEKSVKSNIIFLSAIFLILFSVSSILADGGYIPRPGYWVRPGQQRAVIFYEDNTETMILTSGFIGNARDLVWIVPTPTKPEVSKADEKVFTNAQKLAYPKYSRSYGYGEIMMAATGDSMKNSGVVVIDSRQVDYYDVKTLLATSSNDLVKWFNDNNYSYPKEYSYVLESYIKRGWYFTAIKISPESAGATEVIQDLKEGNPTPVKMVFLSDKIVFPLKISSVDFPNTNDKKYIAAADEPIGAARKDSKGYTWTKLSDISGGGNWKIVSNIPYGYEGVSWGDSLIDQQQGGINYNQNNNYNNYYSKYQTYIPINIYLFADGKAQGDNFNINYGNWVTKKDIEKLGNDENGNPYITPKKSKYFLTHLSANMQKSQMDDDLYLTNAEDNKKVNAGPEAWELFAQGLLLGMIVFLIWIFAPVFGILFIIGVVMLFLTVNKSLRILAWILVAIPFILTFLVGGFFFLIAAINSSLGDNMALSLIITWLFILAIMVIFNLLAIKYRRK